MLNFRLECIKNCCLLRNEIFDFVFFFLSSKAIHCATSCISFDGVRELARYTFRLYVRLIVFYIYRLSLTWSASIRRLGQLRMTGWNKEKKTSSRLCSGWLYEAEAYVEPDWSPAIRRISLAFRGLASDNGPLNVTSCFKLSRRQAALSFFNRAPFEVIEIARYENIGIRCGRLKNSLQW